MLTYTNLDPHKKAFIFELDNVIYPEKDYLLQVYYLFANFIEYTETIPAAADLIDFLKKAYHHHGAYNIFGRAKEAFGLDEKYRENFEKLHHAAILPLKLLLFDKALALLQEIVAGRKQLFLITNGNPLIQLNKIRQTEWNGLHKYITIYFADELAPKPETTVLEYVLSKNKLNRKDLLIIGFNAVDQEFASSAGVDFLELKIFL